MKFTFKQIKQICQDYINPAKIGSTEFTVSKDNLAGLVDKIGLMVTYDGSFYDKLSILDGEDLPFGKTVEEWYQDLLLATEYDETGANVNKPAYPTYRKATYSYTLGRKKFKTTIKYDEYERAVNNASQYADLVSMITKRLSDSEAMFYYQAKKQGIGVLCSKILATRTPSKTFTTSTAYEVGEYVKKDSTPTKVGVIFNKIEASNMDNWDTAVSKGNITELDMVRELEVPVDTATGEAFVKQVKKDIETASFATQGYSLNGGVIGAEDGLVLILKKGVMPTLDVDVLAGAFHAEKLALPAEIIVVDDFGTDTDCFAVLADKRMLKLHNTYRVTREQENGEGDFLNLIRHTENTMHISLNTFAIVYKIKG